MASNYTPVQQMDCNGADIVTDENKAQSESKTKPAYKVYKRRWVMLFMFIVYDIINIMQWLQYSVTADVTVKYYQISYETVDWSSVVFLLLYIPFSFPAAYITDKMGLRVAIIMGSFGTCIGTWIKVGSAAPDRYWVVLSGQIIIAISEGLILPIPSKLAAVWFGAKEVSLACGIGNLATQIGIATCFSLSPMILNSQMTQAQIQDKLFFMAISFAIVSTVFTIILLIFFQDAPPTPPSIAQLLMKEQNKQPNSFYRTLKRLFSNPSYALLFSGFGITIGGNYAISILLNQLILIHHPDDAIHVGIIGMVCTIAGVIGALVCGVILDHCNYFKETTFVVYTASAIAGIAFIFGTAQPLTTIYLISIIYGFMVTGFLVIGVELGVELTFPVPEGASVGLLVTGAQTFGVVLTFIYSRSSTHLGDVWANILLSGIFLVGIISIFCIKYDLKRKATQDVANQYCTP